MYYLYVKQEANNLSNQKVAMDNLIEAAEYLAPHKELFHKELVKLYYFIAADLHKYFNEHEKAEVFSALATEIAIEHVDVSRVFHDKLNRINVYSRDEKFEEAKKEIKIGLALAKQTNNEDFEHIYQFYFFKYLAHVKLNQLDSLAFVNEEIERLCETNLISHNSYMSYFAHILHLDIEINKLENISQQYAYLINELKNTYFSYILHSAMIDYYVKMNNIEKEAFHGTKALDFLGNVIYDEYNLKKIREQLNNLASTLSKKKYYQEADRFRAEIIKIDSVMYDIQKRRSDAYKKSLDFFSNQEVEQANKQVELEKKVRYVYMFLFALVAIFLLFSIYLLYLLFKRNKQINYQKKEIELITNSVSIGLCKIDNNFKLIWANKTIEETYNAAEEFLKSDMN